MIKILGKISKYDLYYFLIRTHDRLINKSPKLHQKIMSIHKLKLLNKIKDLIYIIL
jgi:hypothetical protein